MLRGAVDDEGTSLIVDLYGTVDRKYADPRFVRHQFTSNPLGWSLHVFALEDGRPVGHCALIPMPARVDGTAVVSGKFEAFTVHPDHQASTLSDGRLVGLAILTELYAGAADAGFAVLHDLVPPDLGLMHRLHGAHRVPVPWQTLVGVGDRRALRSFGGARAAAARGLARWQQSLRSSTTPFAGRAVVREVAASDEPPPLRDGRPSCSWTIEAADMWEWLVGTRLLVWVEERSGGRALVRLPGPAAQSAELLDWQPGRRPLAGAVATINEVARLGTGGRSVRISNPRGDARLLLAAQLLGFLPAPEPLTLYVKSMGSELDATDVTVTPYFFATF